MDKDSDKLQKIIFTSFKENFRPGFILQCLALSVVLLYFFLSPFHLFLDHLGELKSRGGVLASGIITMIFGGLFPFTILLLTGKIEKKQILPMGLFFLFFWLWKGMEVDLFYKLQAFLFGDSNRWNVVAKKVIVDQFVYGPLWAAPTMMIFYLWKDSEFNFKEMKNKFLQLGPFQRILRILASNLIVWLPAVTIIYLLPLSLQMPLFNLVLMFWTLILNSVASK